jgi:hypothetical protein
MPITSINGEAFVSPDVIPDGGIATKPDVNILTFDEFLNLFWEWRLHALFWKYVSPAMIVLGTIFNVLTIAVLLRRKFGKSSTRILLIVLALADTAVLWTGLLRQWVNQMFDLNVRHITAVSCPLHIFLTYFFLHFASWNVALLTVERWISVSFPLKARVICTQRWTTIVLILLFIFLFGRNSHMLYFYTLDAEKLNCSFRNETYENFWTKAWFWIDILAYSCLPFLVIGFCNCSILHQVIKGQIRRKKLQNPGGNKDSRSAQLTSMTYMLTTVSVMFILLTLPSGTYFIVVAPRIATTWKQVVQYQLIYCTTNLFGYFNNTINFLLYCVSGTQFRREVYRMFQCLKRGEGRSSLYNPSQTFQTLED